MQASYDSYASLFTVTLWIHCISVAPQQITQLESYDTRWRSPPHQWYKLNSDGAFLERLGMADAGAVLRDEQGGFKGGLSLQIYLWSVLLVEMRAMDFGLTLAIKL